MGLEDDFLLEDADDEKTVEFIKNYLPQELKEKFEDDELYYFLDLIDEYYSESGILDAQPDNDGYVNIYFDEVAAYIAKEAKKDDTGAYDPEEILFVVQGEMEYGNSLLHMTDLFSPVKNHIPLKYLSLHHFLKCPTQLKLFNRIPMCCSQQPAATVND